ncbi:hypothetical protein SGUI_0963 [Serinicoccus hydrothermalis]|uniref:SseB protein N-terminal domain-containing protein n=1 Tax=Serinicoccus hydrothermalis TaxID=1758689 RepID=A0A1B1NAA1_9MICO|nr:hypothetical protein [Serinicoccus hydrothermalis]ANS78359.1 hypothetical protein SGUI_0963 [Serinicoccus hydrothermalis]
MTDPTDMPFQGEDRPSESIYQGERPAAAVDGAPVTTRLGQLAEPEETETDVLAARVAGPEDHEGMADLWRATMDLPYWWFIAVGDPGMESPAAAKIDGQLMLLTYTSAERARHFAVQNEMVAPEEDLRAIALSPQELVDTAEAYQEAEIAGLMFDPHLSGYFIPTDQLGVVWDAVHQA